MGSLRKRSALRWAGMALGVYLVCDGFSGGPVFRGVKGWFGGEVEAIAARVGGRFITRSQLERALHERLWLEGKDPKSLTGELLKEHRRAALEDLIDRELLRENADSAQIQVSEDEVNQRFDRFVQRFESKDGMLAAAKQQGLGGERELRERLAAIIRQEKFLEAKIGQDSEAGEDEARKWFEEHRKQLEFPPRVEARHVFISTLDHPAEEAKAKLEAAMADLIAKKKDFATLAKELSEDEATKNAGGSLGWMTRGRLPADFEAPVFSLPPHKPTLVRTRLGWHLLEITGTKPAEERSFEQAKAEVVAALRTLKRDKALQELRDSLRNHADGRIEVLLD